MQGAGGVLPFDSPPPHVLRDLQSAFVDLILGCVCTAVVGDYLLLVSLNLGRSSEVADVLKNVNRSLEMAELKQHGLLLQ